MSAKAYRERFFREHPICCFCGGLQQATTIDHIPSRQTFAGRKRPRGLEFPACKNCQAVSSNDEQLVALLARFYPDLHERERLSDLDKLMEAVKNNFPGLLENMEGRARDRRKLAKRLEEGAGVKVHPSQLALLKTNDSRIDDAVKAVGKKLGLGLYYERTGEILPAEGRLFLVWYTNVNEMAGELPYELLQLVQEAKTLKQGKNHVGDQFLYGCQLALEGTAAVFTAQFRESFLIAGVVSPKREIFDKIGKEAIHAPWNWEEHST